MIYLSSPNTQQQAEKCDGMPVLLSFAVIGRGKGKGSWIDRYACTFRRILIDSGAFSELNSGIKVDLGAYREWAAKWSPHADAVAGLDDISGDWRRSLANYEAFPAGFPTFHETDPPELLGDLIPMARERGGWLGVGLLPTTRARRGKMDWLRDVLARIPADIHVHGWAARGYLNLRRIDSADSTNWFNDAMGFRRDFPWLTYGECLEIVVKRYQREARMVEPDGAGATPLFDNLEGVA